MYFDLHLNPGYITIIGTELHCKSRTPCIAKVPAYVIKHCGIPQTEVCPQLTVYKLARMFK